MTGFPKGKKGKKAAMVRAMLNEDREACGTAIAIKVGCSRSLVSYVRRQSRLVGTRPRVAKPKAAVAIDLLGDAVLEVRIKNGRGNSEGTLSITARGINYRMPNQKKVVDGVLSFGTIAKIMSVGLVLG
ncbi:MAG: hypothetical protein WC378_00270 [Opitutaceae bacterium]